VPAVRNLFAEPVFLKRLFLLRAGYIKIGLMSIDWEIALGHVDGDWGLLAELAALFSQDCPRLLLEARESIQRRDHSGLERAAHTLKGRLAFFGINDLRDQALQLEMMGRAQVSEEAAESLKAIQAEIDRILPEFDSLGSRRGQ
jgi:HPt (histidine-containing phosphotransfer) domain-containing protein